VTANSQQQALVDAVERAADTRAIASGSGALAAAGELFVSQFGRRPAFIVADETTAGLAAAAVADQLAAAGIVLAGSLIFPAMPVLAPTVEHAHEIARALDGTLAIPVAIGSGTINDLAKYGASLADRSYFAVATAASMDGYTASGAALIADGFKQTFTCPAPRAVVADLDLIRTAPPSMTASGYADLIGKITAGADWILADALGIDPIQPDIWNMVQPAVRSLLGSTAAVRAHEPAAIETLLNGLLLTGLAMQASGTSRPASGSEHQFSHYWEMQGLSIDGVPVSHGFKVGLGSLAVTALYELLLKLDDKDLAAAAETRWPKFSAIQTKITAMNDDPRVTERAILESSAKYPSNVVRLERMARLREFWPSLTDRLKEQLVPADQLRSVLLEAGCATTPGELGLSKKRFQATYFAARQIRRRYTVLDTVTELGRFDQFVAELFKPVGYWAIKR
jgi:glycerol-1-phosphate dehydrogenase [NAD(P)+]